MPKLHVGRPLPGHLPDNVEWHTIKIFDQGQLLWSLGVGIVLAAGVGLLWHLCHPSSLPMGEPSLAQIILVVLALAIGHEALHLLGFPNAGLDSHTVIGVWPELGSPYVQYLSPIMRNRYLIAVLMPTVVLTILPFLLAGDNTELLGYLSWISVLNSLSAGSDIFIFSKLVSQVPRTAQVLESGELLYWGGH